MAVSGVLGEPPDALQRTCFTALRKDGFARAGSAICSAAAAPSCSGSGCDCVCGRYDQESMIFH